MAKILYIEDDQGVRESTERLLTKIHGHTVVTRVDTDKADALADQWRPDLVICDHDLGPGKEKGLELAKRLKVSGFKVAILSGSAEAFYGAGKAHIPFFYKPYSTVALLREMEVGL